MLQKRGGWPEDAQAAARLIEASDPPYYAFLFASQADALDRLEKLWLNETGSLSHSCMTVWQDADGMAALACYYPAEQGGALDAADEACLARQGEDDGELVQRSAMLAWLFPHIPAQTAYLRTLAVTPRLQGQGVGQLILQEIISTATQQGATELHTDVDSGNPGAVRFYLREGFELVAETRVPMLTPFNLPTSYRMVKKLA